MLSVSVSLQVERGGGFNPVARKAGLLPLPSASTARRSSGDGVFSADATGLLQWSSGAAASVPAPLEWVAPQRF